MATIRSHRVQKNLKPYSQIKNVIAIGSGKGGVGKSTVSYFLARALVDQGYRVGIADTDIYGPSLCVLSGISKRLGVTEDKKFIPHCDRDLHMVSIAHLVNPEDALIWRGPMACGAVLQLIEQTLWPALDFLLLDMPPGTGDILLSIAQKVPLAGAVLIRDTHRLSFADYQKSLKLFEKTGINVLGTVINQHLPHHHIIDNTDGILGAIPYDSAIWDMSNEAQDPFMAHLREKHVLIRNLYQALAQQMLLSLSQRPLSLCIPIKIQSL